MLKIIFATYFWSLFGFSILLHLWTGGVVIDQKISDGVHFFLLRENPDQWMVKNKFVYWAKIFVERLIFVTAISCVIWFFYKWWTGDLKKND